jgi:DNA adenine methylase
VSTTLPPHTPASILDLAYQRASSDTATPLVNETEIIDNVEYICRNIQNRAGVRLLMACLLAKIHNPAVDVRKPYTEIGGADTFSGRAYDEGYITRFITDHDLPCNPTTAFLTPALRNRHSTLTTDLNLVGRPPRLYQTILQLLDDVHSGKVSADDLLAETVRWLLVVRDEQRQRMETLLAGLQTVEGAMPLSSEAIVRLVEQHLNSRNASRLPVLVVAAAYQAASEHLGERVLPLGGHNAADKQTGALGDVEITLLADGDVITCYEMKDKRVTINDINRALQKITESGHRVDNYIFITTDIIDIEVKEYAAGMYDRTGGIEIAILDCISFLRHFLHLFHRLRMQFLEEYQRFLLVEPDSAVNRPLKEAFLALRQAAEITE